MLQFSDYPEFSVPIGRWGSRVAHLVYASGQGSVLDPHFSHNFDCSKINMTSYQHCSRLAYYLRLKETSEKKGFQYFKTAQTYLKHVPGKPKELSDENYVVTQEWIKGLTEIRNLPKQEQEVIIKNISSKALQEIYDAIRGAALWDMANNLAITGEDYNYYMVDLEQPFNHKPQFFYFQTEEGKKKYVQDTIDGLERMAKKIQFEPNQLNTWKQITERDFELQELCTYYTVPLPNYEKSHLDERD